MAEWNVKNFDGREEMKKLLALTFGAFAWVVLSPLASADPIGPNCGTCQGSIYVLTYPGTALADADPLHETFEVTLTINTAGYTRGGTDIDDVAVKVSNSVSAVTLVAAPTSVLDWTVLFGALNSGGCNGSGSGFVCTQNHDPLPEAAFVGGILSWTFDITVDNGALFTGAGQSSIKTRYVNAADNKVGDLVSEEITLQRCTPPTCNPRQLTVPEPATLRSEKRRLSRRFSLCYSS